MEEYLNWENSLQMITSRTLVNANDNYDQIFERGKVYMIFYINIICIFYISLSQYLLIDASFLPKSQ